MEKRKKVTVNVTGEVIGEEKFISERLVPALNKQASDLTTMTLDGVEIKVHPSQVGPWQAQGWTVKE